MDRKPYDWFTQELLMEALAKAGRSQSERKVTRNAQFIDLTFVPGPAHAKLRKSLGLLGEMTREPCLLEVFRKPPSLSEVLECMNKQLTLHHRHDLAAQRAGKERPKRPWRLWLISAGRPNEAISGLRLARMRGMPRGVYAGAAPGQPLGLVVVSELPRTRSTLTLRLLGAGRQLDEAAQEVIALEEDDPLRQVAEPLVIELRVRVEQDPDIDLQEKARLTMATQTFIEAYNKRLMQGALVQGREEGVLAGKAETLLSVLAARGLRVGAREAAAIRRCDDLRQLDRWVKQAVKVESASELFGSTRKAKRARKTSRH